MPNILPLAFATTSALFARERGTRQNAERLAAALLETLLNAIDANDPMTGSHVRRVARFGLILADAADLDDHECHKVERVALFHDIGKISEALFDIIHDDSKLSPQQKQAIATHPQRGAEVLAPLAAFYPELAEGVLSHHERWDGTGYPRKLAGAEIPLTARIVSIADSFDAITHARRYKPGRSAREGARIICEGRGKQFDPDLTDLFLCPPVFECIEAEMEEARVVERHGASVRNDHPPRAPRAPLADRRHGDSEARATPDVKFRWRESALEQPR
ncbi:MAG TPA: HD domain-containing phosphohydrolase [Gemmatimonadaceae bacterium]|nr:HD domain-containing phosphohydrolase [Gemmatimonadaceae bacterium]